MSTPPASSRTRKRAAEGDTATSTTSGDDAGAVKKLSLSKRLPDMTDYQLSAYHSSALRISADPAHPKNLSAAAGLPLIVQEMKRRADGLKTADDAVRAAAKNKA